MNHGEMTGRNVVFCGPGPQFLQDTSRLDGITRASPEETKRGYGFRPSSGGDFSSLVKLSEGLRIFPFLLINLP